jgi:hypothetical protein
MAEVFIGQVLQGNVFWTLACSGLLAIPEYVRWGKAGPPSKSAWFWMAREHDHSTPPHTSQSTETYISTLLQKASDVTITVPTTITTTKKDVTTVTTTQKEPTTIVKGAGEPITVTTTKNVIKQLIYTSWRMSTTTSKTTRTSYIPSTTLTELRTITLYRTNTQTFYQAPSTSTVIEHTEITTTSTIRPTFTRTITETVAPTATVYSDLTSPDVYTFQRRRFLIALVLASIAVAYGALKYGVSMTHKKIGVTERQQKETAEIHTQSLEDRKNIEREKEKAEKENAKIKKDAEDRVAQASVNSEDHKLMLGRLKSTIKDLDGHDITNACLRDDGTFAKSLALWKSKRHEILETARGGWRTREHKLQQELNEKDHTIEYHRDRVEQLKNVLTQVGKEQNIDFASTAFDYASRAELDKLTKDIFDLRTYKDSADEQIKTLHDRNAKREALYKSMSEDNDKYRAAVLEGLCIGCKRVHKKTA